MVQSNEERHSSTVSVNEEDMGWLRVLEVAQRNQIGME
jgi:hypothetical protein